MACSFFARFGWIGSAVATLSFAICFATNGIAGDQETQQRFEAHLAAGEFGPARQLANQTAGSRDRMFQRLAAAQARAGAHSASFSTAADIRNDVQRQTAYSELSNHPMFGGARGGAALADFDSLIELIKTTISPD